MEKVHINMDVRSY